MKDINAMSNNDDVIQNPNWQVQCRGKDWDEYQIYVAQISSLGIPIKSFDEWLNS
jgi:hypothetical protein